VNVRAAGIGDLDSVLQLAIAFYAEDGFTTPVVALRANLQTLLTSAAARTAVVVSDQKVVAFAITTTSFGLEAGPVAELEDLYVVPPARRRGIAARLIEDSAHWSRERGCRCLELLIAPNGRDVTHLYTYYRDRGFHDDGRRLLTREL
jgi:aminoglycoside 6'-N-acetyltransferase I